MSYISFENKGEVPINAFKLLGASTKRQDSSKIGYFGTGLKYALAVLLREDIEFKVYSGLKEVKIGLRKTKFIEDTVNVMTVNGEKTSITIDAGIDWEPWFAVREIYSNTLDENGEMKMAQAVQPEVGKTKIYIQDNAAGLSDLFKNWAAYFTNTRDMAYKDNNGSILPKLPTVPEFTVFRKGIRAYTNRQQSIFDYDLNSLDINESRVAKYDFQVKENCSELLAGSTKECIEKFINIRYCKTMEWEDAFWDMTGTYTFGDAWLEVLQDKRVVPYHFAGHYDITETTVVLPDSLIKKLKNRFGDSINLVGDNTDKYMIIDNIDKSPLQKILDAYSTIGLPWELEKIDIVTFNDKDLLGMADEGRVLLSGKLFETTFKHRVASTLLEEIVHASTGFGDCTRELQSYLFDVMVNLSKELSTAKGA